MYGSTTFGQTKGASAGTTASMLVTFHVPTSSAEKRCGATLTQAATKRKHRLADASLTICNFIGAPKI
jgi:hypothetical protein